MKALFWNFLLPTGLCLLTGFVAAQPPQRKVPILYCTDLFHPPDDPDDHLDAAVLYGMPEVALKAVILDQGRKQQQKTGKHVLAQLAYLTGKNVPAAHGLADPLQNPEDKGLSQEAGFGEGTGLILKTLREAPQPLTVVAVGSARDLAAAYNREPDLFKKKVSRMSVFMGEASDTAYMEYNVKMDIHAFVRLMQIPVPIDWIPCFDGGLWTNRGNASFWNATHADLLAQASDRTRKYVLYMLTRQAGGDYPGYYAAPLDSTMVKEQYPKLRALWGTAVFGYLSGRPIVAREGRYLALPPGTRLRKGDRTVEPFGFKTVTVRFNNEGDVQYGEGPGARQIRQFYLKMLYPEYRKIMTSVTAHLLGELEEKKARP